jgi:glycosyltransferase involved in cell wall biosynthesis
MRILFLTDGINPFVTGGMQQYASVLVKLLLNEGVIVTLVHCGERGNDNFTGHIDSLFTSEQIQRLETIFIPFLNQGKWPGHYIYENKKYSNLIYQKLKERLNDFDFVYAQGFTGWAFGKNKMKPKLLVNFHGFEMYQKAPNLKVKLEHYLLRPFVKLNCLNADYVYSFGGKITDIIKALGVKDNKILYQSNGIENKWLSKPKSSSKPLRYIFIGRNERRKGIEELTQALINIKNEKKFDFEFTFIGPIQPHSELRDLAHYTGEIKDQAKIHEYIHSADVLVCPSHAEGMPTVILEAMANGLAIITTDVGASSRMIEENGILLNDVSPKAIKNAITTICNTPKANLDKMKTNSLKMVKKDFIWEVIARKLVMNLQQILT